MTDQLERELRDALTRRSAQLDPDSLDRLRALDYHPRRHRIRRLPALGALGTAGVAGTVAAIVTLTAGAAPAFAGWQRTPQTAVTAPPPAASPQDCGQGLGSAVLTDARGPYTASIYAQNTTTAICLAGNGVSMDSSSSSTVALPGPAAGRIGFGGGGEQDTAGNALTLADGRTGAGVTAVTLQLSDGSSVQATVDGGWYLAWWPGSATATSAQITTSSGTQTVAVPQTPAVPPCPAGARCTHQSSGTSQLPGDGTGTGTSVNLFGRDSASD